ncbi:MAG: response regulator [Gemmatimonadales bacterium]
MPGRKMAGRPPVVLLANVQEWSARSLASILEPQGYTILRAYTDKQALEQARAAQPDVVVLDTALPEMGGLAVCRTLRADAHLPDNTPIILTTPDPTTRQLRLDALRAGAWDLRGGPVDAEEFLLRLGLYVRGKLEGDQMGDEGLVDRSSGLYNRSGLARRAREISSEARRQQLPLACVAFAVEGRERPDAATADRLAHAFRAGGRVSDAIGRLEDTAFGVIAPATDQAGARQLAARLSTSVLAAFPDPRPRLRWAHAAAPIPHTAPPDPLALLDRALGALPGAHAAGA